MNGQEITGAAGRNGSEWLRMAQIGSEWLRMSNNGNAWERFIATGHKDSQHECELN